MKKIFLILIVSLTSACVQAESRTDELLVCVSKKLALPSTQLECEDLESKRVTTTLSELYKNGFRIKQVAAYANMGGAFTVVYLEK